MDEPRAAYPRPIVKREWTRRQLRLLNAGALLGTVTIPLWCRPLINGMNTLIERWPSSTTSAVGGCLLAIGALCGASAFRRIEDPATTFLRLTVLTLIAMATIPIGSVLLVEGIGSLSGEPR